MIKVQVGATVGIFLEAVLRANLQPSTVGTTVRNAQTFSVA
jgi:carbonic anhydrase/acetyltransferase-like protein (isoleucine patch superfamily)